MVLTLAITSAVSLGVADYLAGVTLRRDGRTDAALSYTTIASMLGSVFVLAALPLAPPEAFGRADLGWAIAAGIAFGVALPLLMVGMARGPIALVAPVFGLVSLAVPAIVGPLLGDELSQAEFFGLLLAFPAAGLVAITPHRTEDAMPVGQALLLASAVGALLGAAAVFFGRTATDSGIGPAVVAQITATALLFGTGIVSGRLLRPRRQGLGPAAGVGTLSALAVLLSVLAYQRGPVAIVAAVIGLAPGPAVLLAWLLISERINRLQLLGFAFGVAAVVLFAVG